MFDVYLITCNVNQKSYVGITSKTFQRRWHEHCLVAKRGSKYALHNAIRAHGEDAFKVKKLLECLTWKDACLQEKKFISELDTFAPHGHGYNLTLGGEGTLGRKFLMSSEHKKKISCALKGKKKTIEHKEKINTALRVENLTIERLKILRKAHEGFKHAESTKKKMSFVHRGKKFNEHHCAKLHLSAFKRPVQQISFDGNIVAIFPSIKEAVIATGFSSIAACCRGKSKHAGGFIWRYVELTNVIDDNRLLELYNSGLPFSEISRREKIPYQVVRNHIRKLMKK